MRNRGLALSYFAGALSVLFAILAWRGMRSAAHAQAEFCDGFRWPVKTASDIGASTINTSARNVNLAWLVHLTPPSSPSGDTRANRIERTTFELRNVRLTNVLHQRDGDYHFIVQNAAKQTMIVEIPDADCSRGSRLLPEIEDARASADAQFGGTFKKVRTNDVISVRGVGFFDFYHRQLGQAKNGIELHPVTAMCFGRNCSL